MSFPLLNGTRRARLGGLAVFLTVFMLYLVYQAPLTVNQHEPPLGLKPDSNWNVFDVGSAVHDAQQDDGPVTPPTPPAYVDESEETTATVEEVVEQPTTAAEYFQTVPVPDATATDDEGNPPKPTLDCVSFETLQYQKPEPLSTGRRKFPYVRPPPECRKFRLPAMEALLERMKTVITDPDLFRLFENSYPNTLDTMVKWRGYATKGNTTSEQVDITDEELTYVITGDIDAMWLRDSASQIYSYLPLLEPSTDKDSLASLWRGLINSHARYIVISPYCHSFQPPPESGISPTTNGAYHNNHPNPVYDPEKVFDCKWELDSLASFLQISVAYYSRTKDLGFFGKYQWVQAVQAAVDASAAMRLGTYDADGKVLPSAWTFTGYTNRGSETLTNDGLGNPVKENGMVRSAFRPSDDACIFQLLTPSNMMFAAYLEQAAEMIMDGLAAQNVMGASNLTVQMRDLARGIRRGIARDAVVRHRDFGDIFAYEVDGYGGANLMDDANVPSLLAFPLWNYTHSSLLGEEEPSEEIFSKIYQNTRKFILSMANPYFAQGPALSAVGGPHLGPGKGWPMAAIVAALTAFNDDLRRFDDDDARDQEVAKQLGMVLNSTAGTGVVHETVNAWAEMDWTRSWFGWANGLFGELILKIAEDEERRGVKKGEGLLGRSWQD
ncbi:hypothetical protein B0H66DRAFT_23468 [Apodospora peruviana]|uniref:Glycoside hydrolase family 125 protein n=1 Tax=Apodospora peruviana TaxID=516989 RepID=A0AAE0IQL1_9PEZI|nr:hypothetical protein B0H66DRAFT_23468 [Apodospora peruviana]